MFEKFLEAGGGIILTACIMTLTIAVVVFGSLAIDNMIEDSRAKRCIETGLLPVL